MSGVASDAVLSSLSAEDLAVLGSFDPGQVSGAQELVSRCDRLVERDGQPEWMLRDSVRIDALRRLLASGGWRAVQARSAAMAPLAIPSALQTLLTRAINDEVLPVDAMSEDELVAALRVGDWLAKAAGAAARPGDVRLALPSGLERDPIEARLALLDLLRPIRALTANGCIGREGELARLAEFARSAPPPDMLAVPPLQVFGIGGIGKSTLVAQFVLDLAEAPPGARPVWAYLDLDRPTLSPHEPSVILRDILNQAAAQLPEAKLYLEGGARGLMVSDRGQSIESVDEGWRSQLLALAEVVHRFAGGRIVVVIDTFEEAQRSEDALWSGKGTTKRVLDLFRQMASELELRLVVSGRAPLAEYVGSTHPELLLRVEELAGAEAVRLLRHLYLLQSRDRDIPGSTPPSVDDELLAKVVAMVGGSPLTLTLAARVLADEGAAGISGAVEQARTLSRIRQEFVRGFLYHRILDHLGGDRRRPDSLLPEIARAALALRVITPDALAEIVLPSVGRVDLDPEEWFVALRQERGLAYLADGGPGTPPGGTVRIREELRRPALRALRYSRPELVASIHRAAVAYYEQRPGLPGAGHELEYHLAALGAGGAEPEQAGHGLFERVDNAGQLDPTESLREQAAESAALRALADGDLERAVDALGLPAGWSRTTRLFGVLAQVEEARGRGPAAAEAARADVACAERAEDAERYAASAVRKALLLERLGRTEEAVAELGLSSEHELLSGWPRLRLQIQLNRMTLQERRGLDHDRWLAGLQARTALTDLSGWSTDSALVRLLAATLGRDEAGWIRTAVDQVGLGSVAASSFWSLLAEAVAAWDVAERAAGRASLAVAAGLAREPVGPDGQAWSRFLSGSSVAAPALVRLWAVAEPPVDVHEAIRRFYVWWGVDPGPRAFDISGVEEGHFLDGSSLDFSDAQLQGVMLVLEQAYPRTVGLLDLARRSGIEPVPLPVSQQPEAVLRAVLADAAEQHAVPELINAALADPVIGDLRRHLRDAVGETWLALHGEPS